MTEAKIKSSILIVDDNETHAESLREGLERVGHRCTTAYTLDDARAKFDADVFPVVVSDLMLKEGTGLDLNRHVRKVRPETIVLIITAHATVETAVQAMKEGAADYTEKPVQMEELRLRIERLLEAGKLREDNRNLQRQLDKKFGFEGITGNTPAMQKIFEVLGQVSGTDATVLLLGESGTGKELIAKALHNNSKRKKGRFVAINCAALSESLIESELFGHEKGAFTGAVTTQVGKIEYASGGTLLLDEVGDMPPSTQVKLLRVLEQREIMRVGSNKPIPVDIRLIAATNADLKARVEEGKFREDLFFRLHVVTLKIPPLRERKADIPLLIDQFQSEFSKLHGKEITGLTPEARAKLLNYSWPGNVRELRNAVENMVVVSTDSVLGEDDLPAFLGQGGGGGGADLASLAGKSMEEVEKELIRANLDLVGGNREKAAKILGVGERTLYRKIKEYGL